MTKPVPTSEQKPEDSLAELTSDLQRTRADFENFRKNIEKEKAQVKRFATFATVGKILPLLDDFDRALATYKKELSPLKKNYEKTLAALNLEPVAAAPGTPFDPALHEAVMTEGTGEKEEIAEVLRPGYLYEGELLRPALVKIRLS